MFQWKQVMFIRYSLHATVVNATQVAAKPIAPAINSLRYLLPKTRGRNSFCISEFMVAAVRYQVTAT